MADEQPGPADSDAEVVGRMASFFGSDAGQGTPEVAADAGASTEVVSPEEAEEEQPQQPESSDDQESEQQEAEPPTFEIDGQTYTKDELKSAVHGYKDYTRKTQEVADMRRHVDSTLQMQAIQQRLNEVTSEEFKQLQQVQAQIGQYKSIDWTNLDTDSIVRFRTTLDQLREKAGELEQAIGSKQEQAKRAVNHAMQQQVSAAFSWIQKHVPDLAPSSQKLNDVARYAENYGLPAETFSSLGAHVPALAVFAAKAMAFDKLQAGKTSAVAKAKTAPPVLKPGAKGEPGQAQTNAYRQARQTLKKTGSLDAFANALLTKMR